VAGRKRRDYPEGGARGFVAIAPVRCVQCAAQGKATVAGTRMFQNPATGDWYCEPHLPPEAKVRRAPPSPAASRGPPAIATQGLTKRYGSTTAVDDLSIQVPRGGIVGFVGPNGAGKTTTIRMLMGLVRPTSGTATVLGEPTTHPARYLPRVGALIESPSFYPALTGRRNLQAFSRLSGHGSHRVDELLAQVRLADWGDKPYKSYSLGMKQRLGIAATLLADPELLILDEPTNGLDPAGIHEMRHFLRDLARKGKTVFVSSHLMAEVQRLCQSLVVLRQGRLVFQGSVDAILHRHATIRIAARDHALNPRLASLCAQAGLPAKALPDGTLAVQAQADRAAWINEQAMRAGIVLRLLEPRTFDLEETVIEMTGAGAP